MSGISKMRFFQLTIASIAKAPTIGRSEVSQELDPFSRIIRRRGTPGRNPQVRVARSMAAQERLGRDSIRGVIR
ncbi:hypothetical protein DL237_18200 [Pseudooceanicola sediminis]|uniref:Uncharacterized protein n=1 Tax=Pseudooceanicola sediminis TaxID=2211117 RepID=A0A399IVR5_9RHOB|nr:hypothetical protein DL237_18200 [Pseudooceanicola sediminis]|tara:strand:- start:49804 stop:50025 length:222 start_codon:yes stop_codon:yes gene_type:complete